MARKTVSESETEPTVVVRFNLIGLILFSVSLVVAGGLLTSGLMTVYAKSSPAKLTLRELTVSTNSTLNGSQRPHEVPPWGDLLTRDIEVERPEEYVAFEVGTNAAPAWVFTETRPEKVRALLLSCGLDATQVGRAMSPERLSVTRSNLVVHPDEELVFSLTPDTRARFYHELARTGANHYMQFPFCFPEQRVDEWFDDAKLAPELIARIKKLLYPRGTAKCFSDFEVVMRSLPSEAERLALVKALSRQPALLVRLHVGPETDIERLLGYWGRGIQVKDARPLLESVKRLEEGGNLSLMYLLPRFARERLYTFPMPPKANDPAIDCHWSTMNFFNENPDDRFANPAFTVQYLSTNYYRVAKPSLYGDVVLVLNEEGNAIHSAVYLADDIVFTKNGNNYAQPWMLMRLKDLLLDYCGDAPARLAIYRNKNS